MDYMDIQPIYFIVILVELIIIICMSNREIRMKENIENNER